MRRALAIAVAAFALSPTVAAAYIPSPQYGVFELKFGPYTPNVDDEPAIRDSGGSPYSDVFGNDSMFLTCIEVDWQFLQLEGINLGVGGSLGFMQAYAKSKTESGGESADYTVLNVMPFALLAVIRVDALADLANVPLVPFFKVGLDWYLWWILGGGQESQTAGTMGWQIGGGLMIQLDWIDRMTARTFDNEVGVNHSYLFFEYTYPQIEGFGRDGYMYLSATDMGGSGTWALGLALEF